MAEKLVRQPEVIRRQAITRHEQTPGEPRRHHMEAIAGGGLRELDHERMVVEVQLALQGRAQPQLLAKGGRFDTHRIARALHQRPDGADAGPHRKRAADHAFAPDQSDFEGEAAVNHSEERNEGVAWEKDVPDFIARLMEHLAKSQAHRLEFWQQALIVGARERSEERICYRGAVGHTHEHHALALAVAL
jgi:hypothetical protein